MVRIWVSQNIRLIYCRLKEKRSMNFEVQRLKYDAQSVTCIVFDCKWAPELSAQLCHLWNGNDKSNHYLFCGKSVKEGI